MSLSPAGRSGPQSTSSPAQLSITLTVNGEQRALKVAPWTTLLDLLRERLDLTGTKKGCDHGQCGACTVLVDGRRVVSCLTLAVMKDGAEVTTIEGFANGDSLHPLQQAFIDHKRVWGAVRPRQPPSRRTIQSRFDVSVALRLFL